ncbi:carbohydrate ABC transporter permease [Treponema sp.]|uniref:carbohydrate ABC transporter permease n=1 Tax=Treponema sp. TaxID=166 RepID=UPI003FA23DAE
MTGNLRFSHTGIINKVFIIIVLTLMIIYALLIVYPLFNMIVSSLKPTQEILLHPFALPESPDFSSYKQVWVDMEFENFFLNSIIVTVCSMILILVFGSMAAYGIARYVFKGSLLISMLFLSGIILPLKASIIPLFMLIRNLGLMDSFLSVIFIFAAMGIPSTVFILAGFFSAVPIDLEYAARMDGCNDFTIYRYIMMPVILPGIALVTIYNAVPIWNDFFFPLVFLHSRTLKTLPVGLSSFLGQYSTNWTLVFTGLTIAIVPMILLYTMMSKYFIKGLTAGAVK